MDQQITIPDDPSLRAMLFEQEEQRVFGEYAVAGMSETFARQLAAQHRANLEAEARRRDGQREHEAELRAQQRQADAAARAERSKRAARRGETLAALVEHATALARAAEEYAGAADYPDVLQDLAAVFQRTGLVRAPYVLEALEAAR